MSGEIYVPLVETVTAAGKVNRAVVIVGHYRCHGYVLGCYPAERKDNGIVITHHMHNKMFTLEAAERRNPKRLERLAQDVKISLDTRTGPYWQMFQVFLAEQKLEAAPEFEPEDLRTVSRPSAGRPGD